VSAITALLSLQILSWLWTCLLAVPVWLLWTVCGLGRRYFGFLPEGWQSISLSSLIGLFLTAVLLRSAFHGMKWEIKA